MDKLRKIFAASIIATAAVSQAAISETFGSIYLGTALTNLSGNAFNDLDGYMGQTGQLNLGYASENGMVYQLELRRTTNDVFINGAEDNYEWGNIATLEIGHEGSRGYIGAFASVMKTRQDPDDSDTSKRKLIGIKGEYNLSDAWSIYGRVGRIDIFRDGGTDWNGRHSIFDGNLVEIGAARELANNISLSVSAFTLSSLVTDSADDFDGEGVAAQISKRYENGLSAHFGINYMELTEQEASPRTLHDFRAEIGVSYTFGKRVKSPKAGLRIEEIVAQSASPL